MPRASITAMRDSTLRAPRFLLRAPPRAELALEEQLSRLVRAPHERTRRDEGEPVRERAVAQLVEARGRDILEDGQVPLARAEVLAEGEDLDPARAEVAEALLELVVRLAEAEHEARLRDRARRDLLEALEDRERELVAAARVAHLALEAAHDLEVVREDVRAAPGHDIDRVEVAHEVAGEDLDEDRRVARLQLADGAGDVLGAAVREVVAVDHGEDDVIEAEGRNCGRNLLGLKRIRRRWPSRRLHV